MQIDYRAIRKARKELRRAKCLRRKGMRIIPSGLFGMQYEVLSIFKSDAFKMSKDQKMSRLKEMANLKFKNYTPYAKRRKCSHSPRGYHNCFVCGNKPEVVHHIIQIQYGGYDNGINRIAICNSCHEQIHDWMLDMRMEQVNKELDREVLQIAGII